jgi:hypothetical protein
MKTILLLSLSIGLSITTTLAGPVLGPGNTSITSDGSTDIVRGPDMFRPYPGPDMFRPYPTGNALRPNMFRPYP